MIADKIKTLRELNGLTQADLARQLGITRSSVNAWEMGISVPSTQFLVELARIFKISSDYLLGLSTTATMDISGLDEADIEVLCHVANHLRNVNGKQNDH